MAGILGYLSVLTDDISSLAEKTMKGKAGSGRPQPHEDTGDAGKRQDFRRGGGTPFEGYRKRIKP